MSARREKRLGLEEKAELAPNDWSRVEIVMLECTDRNFRAATDVKLKVGDQVTLEVPGLGPAAATVSWTGRDQFAATFACPVDLDRVRFMAVNQQAVLARLLKERALAYSNGRHVEERALRRRILRTLPLKKITDARR